MVKDNEFGEMEFGVLMFLGDLVVQFVRVWENVMLKDKVS